jgi:hypothetical protein
VELLKDIFISPDHVQAFKNSYSTKDYYSETGWKSVLESFLRKQLIPKINYLNFILKHSDEFEEVKNKELKLKKDVLKSDDLQKLTFPQFFKIASVPQLFTIIGFIIGLLIGTFGIGYKVHSWKVDKQNYDLHNENKELKKQVEELKTRIDSLKNSIKVSVDTSGSN